MVNKGGQGLKIRARDSKWGDIIIFGPEGARKGRGPWKQKKVAA